MNFFLINFSKISALIWLQLMIATELLIFSTRVPGHIIFCTKNFPSIPLLAGVAVTIVLVTILTLFWKQARGKDVAFTLAYTVICFLVADVMKRVFFGEWGEQASKEVRRAEDLADGRESLLERDQWEERAPDVDDGSDTEQLLARTGSRQVRATQLDQWLKPNRNIAPTKRFYHWNPKKAD